MRVGKGTIKLPHYEYEQKHVQLLIIYSRLSPRCLLLAVENSNNIQTVLRITAIYLQRVVSRYLLLIGVFLMLLLVHYMLNIYLLGVINLGSDPGGTGDLSLLTAS